MIIVSKLAAGVTSHFKARASEWANATIMSLWGWILVRPTQTFPSSPAFSQMARWADEATWGKGALTVGLLRLLALVINGTFSHTWYGRLSPHVRGTTAFLSCFVWMQISLGFLASGIETPGLAVYPVLFVLDLYNSTRAFSDAGAMDRVRSNGRS